MTYFCFGVESLMKISHKLRGEIIKSFEDYFFNILCVLDEKDRENKISHSVWRELYEQIQKEKNALKTEIFSKIDSYSGKR